MTHAQTFHLLSDSANADPECLLSAALAECQPTEPTLMRHPLVHTEQDVAQVFDTASETGGIIVYTLLDSDLRQAARALSRQLNVPSMDMIGPVIWRLTDLLEIPPRARHRASHRGLWG